MHNNVHDKKTVWTAGSGALYNKKYENHSRHCPFEYSCIYEISNNTWTIGYMLFNVVMNDIKLYLWQKVMHLVSSGPHQN